MVASSAGMLSVAIVGGGIGGIAAAAFLERAGLPAVVYGQAEVLREVGAGLVLAPWIRQQHRVPNVSSAPVFVAAASQRTKRVELGRAVIPIGYESPFRLAEDLPMVDVLSPRRLQAGFSAGVPPTADLPAGRAGLRRRLARLWPISLPDCPPG
jgi:hypothetical protein